MQSAEVISLLILVLALYLVHVYWTLDPELLTMITLKVSEVPDR